MDYIKSGSSEVDWCESNYQIHPYIAEFFNTFSNGLFFILPPILMVLFKDFAIHVSRGIHFIWLQLIAVGIGSVYFHATLTLAGQLMDELFILWVLMTSYTILFPEKYLSNYLKKNRTYLSMSLFAFTLFVTYLCCLNPKINAYFLLLFSIPIMAILFLQVKECNNKRVEILAKRTVLVWLIAVLCWITDRVFCDVLIKLNLPYFHSIFHVLVLTSSCSSIVLFSFFTAIYKVPEKCPKIAYWPDNNFYEVFRLPYVKFASESHNGLKQWQSPSETNGFSNGNHHKGSLKTNGHRNEVSFKIA